MIDSAATTSAIKLDLLDSLDGHTFQKNCRLSTFGKNVQSQRDFANFEITPLDGTFTLDVKNALVGNVLTTERDKPPRNDDIKDITYMDDVTFDELDDPTISVILDAKFAWTWAGGEIRSESKEKPIAIRTMFGWTLIGPKLENSLNTDSQANICLLEAETCQLQTAIDHLLDTDIEANICLLEVESGQLQTATRHLFRQNFVMLGEDIAPPEKIHPSVKDDFSKEQLDNTMTFDTQIGHYKVGLPWREGREAAMMDLNGVDSYANARMRLLREKTKMEKDDARKEGVFAQMEETIGQGHARGVAEKSPKGVPVWYMPIHVVTRPDKPGKFRICQDAASKVSGVYLNQHLCIGPDNLNSLLGVILRAREAPVALTGDIKAFFHQIHVNDSDVAALRFLFFEDRSMRTIIELESLVHIFGASSSPPVANYTLKAHAQRIRQKYGDDVYLEIVRSFYVDDFISAFNSIEEARSMRVKVTNALAEGGFELTKFNSSHPEVLIDNPESSVPFVSQEPETTFEPTQAEAITQEASEEKISEHGKNGPGELFRRNKEFPAGQRCTGEQDTGTGMGHGTRRVLRQSA